MRNEKSTLGKRAAAVNRVDHAHQWLHAGLTKHKPWTFFNETDESRRCTMPAKNTGLRCRIIALAGSTVCHIHAGSWRQRMVSDDMLRLEQQVKEYIQWKHEQL